MFKPEIYAKSALVESNLACKEKIGCDGIEVQLLDELINGKLGSYFDAKDVFDFNLLKNFNIKAVHAPLLGHYGLDDVTLENLCDASDFKLLEQVCYIANKIGEYHNRNIIVIVHSEMSLEVMSLIGETWERIIKHLGYLLFKYPYVEFGIENVTAMNKLTRKKFILSNNIFDDNIEMVKILRDQLDTDRVGTVLDTCHASVVKLFYDTLYPVFGDEMPKLDMSMENYFRRNAPYVKLFHFSDTIGNGCGKGKHGQPFTEDSKYKLFEYLDLYYMYNIKAPITLEVAETDYLVCDGYTKSKQLVDEYFKNRKNHSR
jgi:hypothetical protein